MLKFMAQLDKIYININEQKFEVNLEDNSTTSALAKVLPLEYTMNDLNGNEKYVYMDETLPTNPYEPKHIEAGDVMLFGNKKMFHPILYETIARVIMK